MSQVASVSDRNFEAEVVNSTTPVLVDFYAVWCPPCKVLAPVIDEIARDYAGKLKVVKCDVEEAQGIAASMGIQSIPTLVLFKGGRETLRRVGAVPKATLVSELARAI